MRFVEHHTSIGHAADAQSALDTINARVNGVGFQYWIGDGEEAGYDRHAVPADTLLILGHYDHAYAHILELVFHGVIAHTVVAHAWRDRRDQFYVVPEAGKGVALQQLGQPDVNGCLLFGIKHAHSHQAVVGMPMYVLAKGCSYLFL